MVRLGGFFDEPYSSPEAWVAILQSKGYTAAYAPFRVPPGGSFPEDDVVLAYRWAAEDADIVIAEVGAWGRNCLSEDENERQQAVVESIRLLEIAEKLGARCVVNVAGRRQHPAHNFTDATFQLIVDTVRRIVDAVNPIRAGFTLELIPGVFPYSCDSYLDLLQAVDRPGFGVHFDLTNIIVTPYHAYRSAELIHECVDKLGPFIKSCHAKDVSVSREMVVHIDETRPGLGSLDYPALLHALNLLDPDMPLMMEHLSSNEEYDLAAAYIRSCGEVR